MYVVQKTVCPLHSRATCPWSTKKHKVEALNLPKVTQKMYVLTTFTTPLTDKKKQNKKHHAMSHPQGPSWSSHAGGSSPAGGGLPPWCHTRSRHAGHPGIPRSVAAAAGHMWWWCWPPSKDCRPQCARTPPASCLESVLSAGPGPPETRTEEWRDTESLTWLANSQLNHILICVLQPVTLVTGLF